MELKELAKDTLLRCPECGVSSYAQDWKDCEVGCEDCGSHPAVECPECEARIDMVTHDIQDLFFETAK